MVRQKNKWKHGDKSKIAEAAGVTRSYLTHVLQGNRIPRPRVAAAISEAAFRLGYRISREDILFPQDSKNPLLG